MHSISAGGIGGCGAISSIPGRGGCGGRGGCPSIFAGGGLGVLDPSSSSERSIISTSSSAFFFSATAAAAAWVSSLGTGFHVPSASKMISFSSSGNSGKLGLVFSNSDFFYQQNIQGKKISAQKKVPTCKNLALVHDFSSICLLHGWVIFR